MSASRSLPWLLRAAWLVLPFTVGPVLDAAGAGRSRAVQVVVGSGSWAAWAIGLVALLVPSTVSLTVVRVLAPAVPAAAAAAGLADGGRASAAAEVVALASGGALAVLAMSAVIGEVFAQASAYGDETRRPLRAPGLLLLGPIPVVWAVAVGGPVAGALLLAAGPIVAGLVVLAVALPLSALLALRLHRLSRRWVVFVPAGMVLHDHLALADSVLFRRSTIRSLGPALAGTDATDCTAAAPGLALELRLDAPAPLLLAGDPRHRQGRPVTTAAVLFAPSRPGAVLAEAARRGLPVGPSR